MSSIYELLSGSEKNEIEMYGVTIKGMRESVEQSINVYPKYGSYIKMAVKMLNDAQEELKYDPEFARQTINRVKWILSNYCVHENIVV